MDTDAAMDVPAMLLGPSPGVSGTVSAQLGGMTVNSTIRSGSQEDYPALEQLLAESGGKLEPAMFASDGRERHLVVLDAPDHGLAAAAVLVIEGRRGHLALLAIAKRFEGQGLEDRVISVLEAMSSAFGAETLDVHPLRAA